MRIALPLAALLLAAASRAAPLPAPADEPMLDLVVLRADTLIDLSRKTFVAPDAWREVARLNRLRDPNRILPGQVLRVPARLLRYTAVDGRLVSVNGDVRIGDVPAGPGATLGEGQSVQTGAASSVVVELADGSQVKLPPSSLAQVLASRRYGGRDEATEVAPGWFAGTLRLVRGSVEVFATKVLRAKPLEVRTPTAVVGVRGTHYRVALSDRDDTADPSGSAQPPSTGRDSTAAASPGLSATHTVSTHSEVLDGLVRFDTPGAGASLALPVGFGASSQQPREAVALRPAPDLSGLPLRFERTIVRFDVPGNDAALRVQVAADDAFDHIVSDQLVAAGTQVRVAGLDDGPWFVRARRVDALRIEGFDATRAFVLKARPEPPPSITPRADSKQTVGPVDFAWAQNTVAPAVHLQVAEDEAFTRLDVDQDGLADAGARTGLTKPGVYFWRLRSIRPDGDHGPFGDVRRFELRPLPEPATLERSVDGRTLIFHLGGRPQDRREVQLARDPAFTVIVAEQALTSAEWAQPLPADGGRYYFRYRSIEPDGFVTGYSESLTIEVPRDWSGLWLLAPLILLL